MGSGRDRLRPPRLLLLGNAGSGKSRLARRWAQRLGIETLCLDSIAYGQDDQRRPLADSIEAARAFIARHPGWIIEGCYGDILEPLLPSAQFLVFLNPGIEVCERHCRERPWEPGKFDTDAAQQAQLPALIDWLRGYAERADACGLARHRLLFDAFAGAKLECREPAAYEAEVGALLAGSVPGR